MLPVVAGREATKRQILVYSAMLAAASLLPWALGFAGTLYGAVAGCCGVVLLFLAIRLRSNRSGGETAFVGASSGSPYSTCSSFLPGCWRIR